MMLSVAVVLTTLLLSFATGVLAVASLGWHLNGVVRQAVGHYDNVTFSRALGYSNMEGHVPMQHDSRFPIASNTKVYVAIALYQLQEQGKVKLDRSVSDYLTAADFKEFGVPSMTAYCPTVVGSSNTSCRSVTFISLLDMSAGIPDSSTNQFLPFPGSLGLIVGRFIQLELLFEPGQGSYYYSNPAFMLGAYFVEKFSGMSFHDYIQQKILAPLGLYTPANNTSNLAEDEELEETHDEWWGSATYFDHNNGKFGMDPKRVSEYIQYFDADKKDKLLATGKCSSEFDLGSASGAGGIVSNQRNEAVLYMTLFNFSRPQSEWGAPLLSNASVVDLVRARTKIMHPDTPNAYYAQGLFVLNWLNTTLPQVINYEGMIICSHTANLLDLTKNPMVMTQVWSGVRTFYVKGGKKALTKSRLSEYGNWFGFTAQDPPYSNRESLMAIANYLTQNPPVNNQTAGLEF